MEENIINTVTNGNLTNAVTLTLNSIMKNIFLSIDEQVYELLDNIAFIDNDIFNSIFEKIINNAGGILLICNALILGIIIFYSINYLFSHLFMSKVDSPSQFIFKLIVFSILMNSAFWLCEQIIYIISLVTKSIQNIGSNILTQEVTFSNFMFKINTELYKENFEISFISFDGIIKSFVSTGFINLMFSYSLRYIMIQVFIILSPFAFLCLINLKTEWFFKVWIKTFLSLLLEQILVVIILLLSFCFDYGVDGIISKILYVGIIYALIKTNNYMYMLFGGITTSVQSGINSLKRING